MHNLHGDKENNVNVGDVYILRYLALKQISNTYKYTYTNFATDPGFVLTSRVELNGVTQYRIATIDIKHHVQIKVLGASGNKNRYKMMFYIRMGPFLTST